MGIYNKGFLFFLFLFFLSGTGLTFGQDSDSTAEVTIDSARALTFQYITSKPEEAFTFLYEAQLLAE